MTFLYINMYKKGVKLRNSVRLVIIVDKRKGAVYNCKKCETEVAKTIQQMRYLLTSILLARIVYTDVKERKIENRVIGAGLLAGILTVFCTNEQNSLAGMLQHISWIWAGLYLLYLLKGLGAGDVKLLFMLAVLYSEKAFYIVMYSFLLAAAYILLRMVIRWFRKKQIYEKGEQIAFSIPIVCSVVLCLEQEVMGCFGLAS